MYREGDVETALLRMGIEVTQRGDELIGLCPMHLERTGRQDSNPSWSINEETGVHHCFSCGYKGNLLTLVAEINEFTSQWGRIDLEASKKWLTQNIKVDINLLIKQLNETKDIYIPIQQVVEMSEARLAVFDSPPEWALEARGLSVEAANSYGVLWDTRQEAWILPIRDPYTNKLMGWQEKGQKTRLFRNRPTGVKKSQTLFGFANYSSGPMIIVESPLDCVKLSSLGIQGGVATYGASFSKDQLKLMRSADSLIIAFDNPRIDSAGLKASKEMLAKLKENGLQAKFFKYTTDAKDIGDMGVDEVILGVQGAKHSVFGERAFI
jgi:5S rRNA maturation endonuclease (ribonuclease M5)